MPDLTERSEELFKLYNSDPKLKQYINSLPQDQWLPELAKVADTGKLPYDVEKEKPKSAEKKTSYKPADKVVPGPGYKDLPDYMYRGFAIPVAKAASVVAAVGLAALLL